MTKQFDNMTKQFDNCVFIGRFSPLHNGHLQILKKSGEIANKTIVVIGSAMAPRSLRNPWTANERQTMIELEAAELGLNIEFVHMRDYLYDDNKWLTEIQRLLGNMIGANESTALIGFESDESSFYLSLFPQFTYVSCPTKVKHHATQVREKIFTLDTVYKNMVGKHVASFIEKFMQHDDFAQLKAEREFIEGYKRSWHGAPFPPTFVTVDALVIKSGHILLIERGRNPGKGRLAMPGGFVNQKERLRDAAIRELEEETRIQVSSKLLNLSITKHKTFDDPNRSDRGRTITECFLFDLGSGPLPKVQADDDASFASWVPISEALEDESKFFEDHFHIIQSLL